MHPSCFHTFLTFNYKLTFDSYYPKLKLKILAIILIFCNHIKLNSSSWPDMLLCVLHLQWQQKGTLKPSKITVTTLTKQLSAQLKLILITKHFICFLTEWTKSTAAAYIKYAKFIKNCIRHVVYCLNWDRKCSYVRVLLWFTLWSRPVCCGITTEW